MKMEEPVENITEQSLLDLVKENTIKYGLYTVENRALADFRDGLKPVHRRILWAMYKMGLDPKGGFKKAARVVGECLGKYHPHGNMPVYQAMVTMANLPENLIEGQGNWGSPERGAAADRYTECKLSKYSDSYILDPDYLAVVPMVSNYDGEFEEPVYLPAKVPNVLINGSEGIAMAVSCLIPSFTLASVTKLIVKALKKPVTVKDCMDTLVFNFSYGGIISSSAEELQNFFETGSGTLKFTPEIEIVKNTMLIKGLAPRLQPSKLLTSISNLQNVKEVQDLREGDNISFKVILLQSIIGKEKQDTFNQIKDMITTSLPCQTVITVRKEDGEGAFFKRSTITEIVNQWVKWRINIETKVLNRLTGIERDKLEKLELLLLAIENKDKIVKSLDADDPTVYLCKALKLKTEQAEYILKLSLMSLAKKEKKSLEQKSKEVKAKIKELKYFLENPEERINNFLKEK